ncbi:MAG: serine/threonine-protein kinase [Verrucomicrobiales bacterium]
MTDESAAERYEVTGRLGEGGRGSVYTAIDRVLDRRVAIKRLYEVTDAAIAELKREAAALASLQHPNIVAIYDIPLDEEGGFVVMELVDGPTLKEQCLDNPMPEHAFRAFAAGCLEGLVAAHSKSLIHRDLKPTNLMLRSLPSGLIEAKILDFGLSAFRRALAPDCGPKRSDHRVDPLRYPGAI